MIIPILYHAILSQRPQASSIESVYPRDSLQQLSPAFTTSSSPCTCPQLRSTWDILWSCLATVFACTWVSIHPNSPGMGEGQWRAVTRRIELMIWSILVPEMIIFWALRQWLGARHLARYYKSFGWTTTHGHFLQMGGFMLVDGDQDLEVLTHDRFRSLLKDGTIQFPQISKDEIEALSKGDGLSKTIVVVQTLWFIAQCISRSVQGLVITEIELVTLAFAFLNGLMYFLWWNKPLDTGFTVRVPVCPDRNPVRLPLTSSTATFIFPYLSISIEHMSQSLGVQQLSHQPDIQDIEEANFVDDIEELPNIEDVNKQTPADITNSPRMDAQAPIEQGEQASPSAAKPEVNTPGQYAPDSQGANTSIDRTFTKANGQELNIPEVQQPKKVCLPDDIRPTGVQNAQIHSAADSIYGSQTPPRNLTSKVPQSASRRTGGLKWLHDAIHLLWRRAAEMQGIYTLEPGARRLPTFYATIKINTVCGLLHTLIISCVGVGFGAIHCVGWNFVFRTPRDKIIWRISSSIITAFPFVLICYVLLVYRFVKRIRRKRMSRGLTFYAVKGGIFVWYIFVRCLPLYLVARIILLLEALIGLRNLPNGAFAQVEWTKFVPHI